MSLPTLEVDQSFPMPERPRPVVFIGGGGIVRHAHVPAYRMAGFQMAGVYDVRRDTADALATDFEIPFVAESVEQLIERAPDGAIFDIAVPAISIPEVLRVLPHGAATLIQKPMGENLAQANRILQICRERKLIAAVNFQLRYAPYVVAARRLIDDGAIGELHEMEFKVNVHTPWALWDFLEKAPRMEMVYHSIHYLDLIRSFMGEPKGVYARAIKHHLSPKLESSRSAVILNYGDWKRAIVVTNHGHEFGPRHQESYIKWEGTKGAIKAQMGLNKNYPDGERDYLEVWTDGEWREVPLEGSWFPHAFRGTMASVMRAADGLGRAPTDVEDALRTMALVETAYKSSDSGGMLVSC